MTGELQSFPLHASQWLRRYLVISHLLISVSIWLIPTPWWLQLLLTAVVLVHGVWRWRGLESVLPELVFVGQQWQLRTSFTAIDVELLSPCYLSDWLLVLPLRYPDGRCRRLLVFRDSLSADHYRRLKVLLRLVIPQAAERRL